jgi:thioredoxin reductase (NADPH)
VRLCPVCDAFELCGKRIGVLARGEHGLREARFLLNFTSELSQLAHGAGHCDAGVGRQLAGDRIRLVEGTVRQVIPSEGELGVLFTDGEVLKLHALYVGFGVRCDPDGYLEVDQRQCTSVPGLYAAGDVVQSLSQISVAFGQAAIAASAINVSLNDERWP